MINLLYVINKVKLKSNECILFYPGDYNNDDLRRFICDPNFIWLFNHNVSNILIMYFNNKFYHHFIFNNQWIDNENINNFIKEYSIFNLSIDEFRFKITKIKKIYLSFKNTNKLDYLNLSRKIKIDNKTIIDICHQKRILKEEFEINSIANACYWNMKAILQVLFYIKNNKVKYCYQIVNKYKSYLGEYNIDYLAYQPICTSGKDNSILHSHNYNKKIIDNSLILLDIGCKYNYYCSDITRTIPVSGKFNKIQKDIYSIVLKMNLYGISNSMNYKQFSDIHDACLNILYNGLLKLGIITNIQQEIEKKNCMNLFMPHFLGHHIGIEVHDIQLSDTLKTNNVITIEPGIYFYNLQKKNKYVVKSVWNKYKNIGGIRIEDVILIQNKYSIVLSNFPKNITEIETIMQ